MRLTDQERAVLRVLAQGQAPAREVAARLYGVTVEQAINSGQSAEIAKVLGRLTSARYGLVEKHFTMRPYRDYALTEAGRRVLDERLAA